MTELTSTPCIKCGREIAAGAVFCPDCLEDMSTHPVKPGTPVLLPSVPTASIRRAPVRRVRKPEEQIRSLKTVVLWLSVAVAVLTIAFAITTAILAGQLNMQNNATRPGENYSTSEDVAATD